QVSTARLEVSAATPSTPPTTTTIFGDEDLTIAQTLIKMRSEKAKEKGVAFRDEELAELNRAQKQRQKQKEATIAALTEEFDEIQARIDVDHELTSADSSSSLFADSCSCIIFCFLEDFCFGAKSATFFNIFPFLSLLSGFTYFFSSFSESIGTKSSIHFFPFHIASEVPLKSYASVVDECTYTYV
nr:hypothetical protein [Tanacetum cinerariifolium]